MQHEVTTLSGHTDTLTQWSFSDDGRRIYSASKNEKLCWDVTSKSLDPNAVWNPPSKHTQVSVDGRWLIDRDGKNLMLVDRNYKNTPDEKRYRALKTRIDPQWHYERATAATASENWYAATHHFAWLMKHKPEQASFSAGLLSSFQNLKSRYAQHGLTR
jgi:WD40 repeat protein